MKIVNPLYDHAFKYLMDNEQIAKLVLSIILGTRVISLQSKPEETPISDNLLFENDKFVNVKNIKMVRYDFKAIIETETGEEQTVLIELQKYNTPDPITRFRQYLASNYLKEETFTDSNGNEQVKPLPIITIYILGFELKEFDTQAVKILNQPFDIINNKLLNVKSEFANLLTHPSIILQATHKGQNRGTRLEKFLNLFHQKLKGAESDFIIEIEDTELPDEELTRIISYLNRATLNDTLLRQLRYEDAYEKGIKNLEQSLIVTLKEKEEALAKEKEALAKEKEALAKEKEALAKLYESAKQMLKFNLPIEIIMQATGLSREEIEKL